MSTRRIPDPEAEGNAPESPKPRFRGFRSPHYTQIPDEALDELMPELKPTSWVVLSYIMRRTFGFKRNSDNISLSQICTGITTADGRRLDRGTGLSKPTVIAAVKELVERGIVVAEHRSSVAKGHEATRYHLHMGGDPLVKNLDEGLPPPSQNSLLGASKESRQALVKEIDTQETVKQETEHALMRQQQQVNPAREDAVVVALVDELIRAGIGKIVARRLAARYPEEAIRRQLAWIGERVGIKNPAGALRRAIEEDWPPPPRRDGTGEGAGPEPIAEESPEAAARRERPWRERQIANRGIPPATVAAWDRIAPGLGRYLPADVARLYAEHALLELLNDRAARLLLDRVHTGRAEMIAAHHRQGLERAIAEHRRRPVALELRSA